MSLPSTTAVKPPAAPPTTTAGASPVTNGSSTPSAPSTTNARATVTGASATVGVPGVATATVGTSGSQPSSGPARGGTAKSSGGSGSSSGSGSGASRSESAAKEQSSASAAGPAGSVSNAEASRVVVREERVILPSGRALRRSKIKVSRVSLPAGASKRKAVTLRLTLPKAARVVFVVQQIAPRCRLSGSFSVRGKPGVNRVRFRGRVGRRVLGPGTYRLIARAAKGGQVFSRTIVITRGKTTAQRIKRASAANTCSKLAVKRAFATAVLGADPQGPTTGAARAAEAGKDGAASAASGLPFAGGVVAATGSGSSSKVAAGAAAEDGKGESVIRRAPIAVGRALGLDGLSFSDPFSWVRLLLLAGIVAAIGPVIAAIALLALALMPKRLVVRTRPARAIVRRRRELAVAGTLALAAATVMLIALLLIA